MSSSIKGHLPLVGHFHFYPAPCAFQQCASRLLSKVVFRQRASSVKSRLLSKVVLCQKLSSVKGHLPSRSSSSFGSISFLGFSHECGIAMLSLSLFVSLSWSTKMISIIFRCVSISSFRTVTHSLTHSLSHSEMSYPNQLNINVPALPTGPCKSHPAILTQ